MSIYYMFLSNYVRLWYNAIGKSDVSTMLVQK